MSKSPLPTDAELAILSVLWSRGPSTVRSVHDALSPSQGTGYTTVLKLMQLMTGKGLVLRDESQRSHVYRPSCSQASMQRRLLGDMVKRAFAGSTSELVLRALSAKRTSAEELEQIRHLLDKLEQDKS